MGTMRLLRPRASRSSRSNVPDVTQLVPYTAADSGGRDGQSLASGVSVTYAPADTKQQHTEAELFGLVYEMELIQTRKFPIAHSLDKVRAKRGTDDQARQRLERWESAPRAVGLEAVGGNQSEAEGERCALRAVVQPTLTETMMKVASRRILVRKPIASSLPARPAAGSDHCRPAMPNGQTDLARGVAIPPRTSEGRTLAIASSAYDLDTTNGRGPLSVRPTVSAAANAERSCPPWTINLAEAGAGKASRRVHASTFSLTPASAFWPNPTSFVEQDSATPIALDTLPADLQMMHIDEACHDILRASSSGQDPSVAIATKTSPWQTGFEPHRPSVDRVTDGPRALDTINLAVKDRAKPDVGAAVDDRIERLVKERRQNVRK
ncbi:hypothetical protein IAU59_007567 [Kwoniella sp. CBS 9459]